MPIKDKETRKQYFKNYMAKLRAKLKREKQIVKDKEIEEQIAKGNLNFGLETKHTEFMTYEEFKKANPKKTFGDYLRQKRDFESGQHREVPKVQRGFKISGIDLWNENPQKEELSDRDKQLTVQTLEELSIKPNPIQTEKTDFNQQLEEQINRIAPKKKKEESEGLTD